MRINKLPENLWTLKNGEHSCKSAKKYFIIQIVQQFDNSHTVNAKKCIWWGDEPIKWMFRRLFFKSNIRFHYITIVENFRMN